MFEKVQVFENRYDELAQKLCDPSVISSPELYAETMKEYKKALSERAETAEMLNESDLDQDLSEMLEEELKMLDEKISIISDEMKKLAMRVYRI